MSDPRAAMAFALSITASLTPMTSSAQERASALAEPPPAIASMYLSRPDPEPDGYRPRWGFLGTGIGLFAGFYAWAVVIASTGGEGVYAVPLAGPWIAFAEHAGDDLVAAGDFFLGLFQTASFFLLAVGLVTPLVARKRSRATASWDVVPWVAAASAGVSVSTEL